MEEGLHKSYQVRKNKNSNAFLKLRELGTENTKNVVSNHLNINFIGNKITSFKELTGCISRIYL